MSTTIKNMAYWRAKNNVSPLKQKTHEQEVKEVQKGQEKFIGKKNKQLAATEAAYKKQVEAYNTSMDSLSNVNVNYQTQQQKDYNTMPAAAYSKKYPKK